MVDSENVSNITREELYREKLDEMRTALLKHLQEHSDMGQIPEAQMIDMMWPDGKQPKTAAPKIKQSGNKLVLESATKGASIAYLITDEPLVQFDFNAHWQLYSGELTVPKGKYKSAVAERIVFETSGMNRLKIE